MDETLPYNENEHLPYHPLELRQDGGKLTVAGPVVAYQDTATLPMGFSERIEPGAIRFADFIIANRQHVRDKLLATSDSGLKLEKRADGVYAEFELPDTAEGRDTEYMLRNRMLTGFSGEMRVQDDRWVGRHRDVRNAMLYGVAVVDKAAYPKSVAALIKRHRDYEAGLAILEQGKPSGKWLGWSKGWVF